MSVADHTEPTPELSPDIENLSLYFAKIITSKHNQHVILMFVGSAGKGKSWAAVALALGVAEKVAEILGGTPEEYFNFKETFATISKDEVKRVMTKPKKHAILLLDDVAAKAMNARNYRDPDNIDFNSELTTFRPNHNLVIMTTQAGFLIDKVPRNLSHYIIEMEQAYFDYGFTIAKVKQVVYNNSLQKIHYPYLQSGGQKYVRHIFNAPPKDLMDEYEAIREYQLSRAAEKADEKKEAIAKKTSTSTELSKMVYIDWQEGRYGQSTLKNLVKALKEAGLPILEYDSVKAVGSKASK